MFMSTTNDRILVMNGHMTKSYRKLIYGQINDTKGIPKRSCLVLSATRWTCGRSVINIFFFLFFFFFFFFFAHGAHGSVGKKIFLLRG